MSKLKKGSKYMLRSILHVENRIYQKGQECIVLEDQKNYQQVRVVMLGIKDSLGFDAVEYISNYSLVVTEEPSEVVLFNSHEVINIVSNLKELDK